MKKDEQKSYRCVACGEKFSDRDVRLYNFFRVQKTCCACYISGKAQDHRDWCFGKLNRLNEEGRIVRWGYDSVEHSECREECPDRSICPLFLTRVDEKTGKRYTQIGRARKRARARDSSGTD